MPTKPKDTRYILGDNIRTLREESGRSIQELCEPMGWSRAYWNDLERGYKTASFQRLHDIADVLAEALGRNVMVNDLLTERKSSNGKRRKELTGERKS